MTESSNFEDFFAAITAGDNAKVVLMLKAGQCPITYFDRVKGCILHMLVEAGLHGAAVYVIRNFPQLAEVRTMDFGYSPLHIATLKDDAEIIVTMAKEKVRTPDSPRSNVAGFFGYRRCKRISSSSSCCFQRNH